MQLAVQAAVAAVAALALLARVLGGVAAEWHWQHELRLDRDGAVLLRWNSSAVLWSLAAGQSRAAAAAEPPTPTTTALAGAADPGPDEDVLVLELAARTRGYVGLGLSPYTGTMAGADLVLAWVDDAGVAHARDYWADQNGSPTLDKVQDWFVLGARENDTHTVVQLARRLQTFHVMDVQIQPGPMRIIFSWSGADPGRTPHYHGKEQRGVAEVSLLAPSRACRLGGLTTAPASLWLLVMLLASVAASTGAVSAAADSFLA